jgi:hypothetical protein
MEDIAKKREGKTHTFINGGTDCISSMHLRKGKQKGASA